MCDPLGSGFWASAEDLRAPEAWILRRMDADVALDDALEDCTRECALRFSHDGVCGYDSTLLECWYFPSGTITNYGQEFSNHYASECYTWKLLTSGQCEDSNLMTLQQCQNFAVQAGGTSNVYTESKTDWPKGTSHIHNAKVIVEILTVFGLITDITMFGRTQKF